MKKKKPDKKFEISLSLSLSLSPYRSHARALARLGLREGRSDLDELDAAIPEARGEEGAGAVNRQGRRSDFGVVAVAAAAPSSASSASANDPQRRLRRRAHALPQVVRREPAVGHQEEVD